MRRRVRVFIKAVSARANPDSHRYHQREAGILAALDPLITTRQLPIPRLRGTAVCGPWTALIIDDIDGRQPTLPWQPADLDRVLTTLDQLADALTPAPIPVPALTDLYADALTGWRTLARRAAPGDQDDADPRQTPTMRPTATYRPVIATLFDRDWLPPRCCFAARQYGSASLDTRLSSSTAYRWVRIRLDVLRAREHVCLSFQ